MVRLSSQHSYVNTFHPEFIGGAAAASDALIALEEKRRKRGKDDAKKRADQVKTPTAQQGGFFSNFFGGANAEAPVRVSRPSSCLTIAFTGDGGMY